MLSRIVSTAARTLRLRTSLVPNGRPMVLLASAAPPLRGVSTLVRNIPCLSPQYFPRLRPVLIRPFSHSASTAHPLPVKESLSCRKELSTVFEGEMLDLFRTIANQGHPLAFSSLNESYQFMPKSLQDAYNVAARWYLKEAEKDMADPKVINMAAGIYQYGMGDTSARVRKAFELFQRTAFAGYAPALRNLADCYYQGIGVIMDKSLGLDLIRRAAEMNEGSSLFAMGYLCAKGKHECPLDDAKAIEYWQRAAKVNSSEAYSILALRHETGQGVEKNLAKAEEYHRLAANTGDMNSLRRLFSQVMQKFRERITLTNEDVKVLRQVVLRAPATEILAETASHLYVIYNPTHSLIQSQVQNEENKAVNTQTALNYIRLAAEAQSPGAMHQLALHYLVEMQDPDSRAKAMRLLEEAVELGFTMSLSTLAGYKIMDASPAEIESGIVLLKRGCEQNDARSWFLLGSLHAEETYSSYIPLDLSLAEKCLTRAADLNDVTAMRCLASWYVDNKTLPQDLEKAKQLLRRASALGDLDSKFNLYFVLRMEASEPNRTDAEREERVKEGFDLLKEGAQRYHLQSLWTLGEIMQMDKNNYNEGVRLQQMARDLGFKPQQTTKGE